VSLEEICLYLIILPLLILVLAVLHIRSIYKKRRDRDCFRKTVVRLKEVIREKEEIIATLSRPRYGEDPEFLRSERIMMEGIRRSRTVNSKELASFLNLSESTIRNRIFSLCRKLNFRSRAELLAYVMLSVPECG